LEVEDEFGKPFRLMLREAPPEASRAAAAETATGGLPTNALERLLSDVWTQVLSLQSVGVDENFFDCGGTSISMARVNAKLRNSLGRPIPMTAMFQYPTLRSLAVYLSAAGGPPEAPDHDEAEDRGSRRRARMQNRRSTDSKRKTL
jgi:aryl carrier-like protein